MSYMFKVTKNELIGLWDHLCNEAHEKEIKQTTKQRNKETKQQRNKETKKQTNQTNKQTYLANMLGSMSKFTCKFLVWQ